MSQWSVVRSIRAEAGENLQPSLSATSKPKQARDAEEFIEPCFDSEVGKERPSNRQNDKERAEARLPCEPIVKEPPKGTSAFTNSLPHGGYICQ